MKYNKSNIKYTYDSELRNSIRSIVEEILVEKYNEEDIIRKIKGLDAMMAPSSGASEGEKENAAALKKTLQKKLQDLQQTQTKSTVKQTYPDYDPDYDDEFEYVMKTYGFEQIKNENIGFLKFRNAVNDEIFIYPKTIGRWGINVLPYSRIYGKIIPDKYDTFKDLDDWMANNTKYKKIQT